MSNNFKDILYLPNLIYGISEEVGDKKCFVCGKKTPGYEAPFSESFVNWNYLKDGDSLCYSCYQFFKNQDFRKKSFIANQDKVIFLKKEELINTMLNPITPPFFIYVSTTHKKQGWINDLNKISYSISNFYISSDLFDTAIYVQRDKVYSNSILLSRLRELEISKEELRTGNFKLKTYTKAKQENFLHLLELAKNKVKNPLWEVMIYAI